MSQDERSYIMRKILRGLTPFAVVLVLVSCTGCAKRVEKSDKAMEHERWIASLEDSVAALRQEASAAEMRLDEATAEVSSMLENFDYVSKPREVEGYTILKGWGSRYPLTSTGLVARITESEGLELVAALSGSTFSRIAVSAGGERAESAVVPHDQALNYRTAGMTTVAFSGPEADSVAALIAGNSGDRIELSFLENGVTGKISLPEANIRMIAETWRLYSLRREVEQLERKLPLINARVSTLRRLKDRRAGASPQAPDSSSAN